MGGWSDHQGRATSLEMDNIDTDQLIPARFMSVPRSEGYGDYLFYDLRRSPEGVLKSGFPLNQYKDASILVAGPNFGTGSSREGAVYALIDAGIRVVIAPGFGDIFASNAVNNGLLPARLSEPETRALQSSLAGGPLEMTVSLASCTISYLDQKVTFALNETWRTKLINGWDDIDLTFQHAEEIQTFRKGKSKSVPWTWPD